MVEGRWLLCRRRRPNAALRLYCFPHAGGSPGEYLRWADDLPEVEVLGIQVPGRGSRTTEAPLTSMTDLVTELTEQIGFDAPYAFFGHSLGALVAFETARALRARGRPDQPERLILSAAPPPHALPASGIRHLLPDEEFLAETARAHPDVAATVETRPELARSALAILRADTRILETYRFVPGEPLACPLTVFGGTEDRAGSELGEWREYTTGPFSPRLLPGDHFYFRSLTKTFLSVLADELLDSEGEQP